MSALPPKADIAERGWHVRFVPITDIPWRSVLEPKICGHGNPVLRQQWGSGVSSSITNVTRYASIRLLT
jgi:hypothetical protein